MKHQIQNTRSRGVRTSAAILTATALAACGGGSSGTAVESFSYAEDGFTYLTGVVAPTLQPTGVLSGEVTYSVTPALPAGLTLDETSGAIEGEPTGAAAAAIYTVTASAASGTYSDTVTLEVRESFGTARFAYTLDWDGARVQTWRVDAETGSLTRGNTVPSDSYPFRAVSDPLGRFLYVSHFGTGTLGTYQIDADNGDLTLLQLLPVGSAAFELAMSPNGRFLVSADVGTDIVASHAIDPDTGLLAPSLSAIVVHDPSGLALNAAGDRLFAASITDGSLASYAVDRTTGQILGQLDSVSTPGPVGIGLAGDEGAIYTANSGVDALSSFSVDLNTGELALIESVFSGEEPVAVIVDTTGTRLSVANLGGRQIESFNIAVNRKLQLIDTIALPGSATNLIELPVVDGLLAPLFDEQLISLTRYDEVENLLIDRSVQAASGRVSDLTLVATSREATLTPRHVYTANLGAGDVQALAWNPLSNQLETNGPSIATGGKPSDLALSLDGSQLLVADQMDAAVLALSRDLQTGELDLPGANGPAGPLTRALAINPKDGGILAIANGGLTQFDLDNDGSLSSVASVAAGATPEDLVISPDGRFAYVANRVSGDISAFAIGEGQLTELPASPYSDGGVSSTRSVALSPDGRLLAVSAGELDRIRIFEVDRATGELTFQQDCHVGDDPRDLTWSLNGRRLYVALYRDNAVAYADRKVDDQLILRGSLVAGEGPLGITLDPSGEQLFVAAYDSDTVEVLDIAPDGALTRSDSFPAGNGVGPAAIATLGVWNDVNP